MQLMLPVLFGAALAFTDGLNTSLTISHPAAFNEEFLIYVCGDNKICPSSRECVVDEVFDYMFMATQTMPRPNCSCAPGGCELCLHKSLWPVNAHDLMGGGFLFSAGVLSGAVGLGGGGLNVPIMVMSMNFHVKEAVPLSHVAVFGSAAAQNLINLPRRHPLMPSRPLVDAGLALLLMPCLLIGHSLGVILGPVLPAEFIEAFAVFVLIFAAAKTARSAIAAYRREQAARSDLMSRISSSEQLTAQAQHSGMIKSNSTSRLCDESGPDSSESLNWTQSSGKVEHKAAESLPSRSSQRSRSILLRWMIPPWWSRQQPSSPDAAVPPTPPPAPLLPMPRMPIDGGRVLLLLLVWVLLAADYRIADASAAACRHENRCFLPYAILVRYGLRVILYGMVAVVIYLSVKLKRAEQSEKADYGVPHVKGDVLWTLGNTIGTQSLTVLAGTIAGLLGLGGGEIMAPLLVGLGMIPEVTSAVNAFMILFTASADLYHYSEIGVLQLYKDTVERPGYVALALLIAFCGALVGRVAAVKFVARLANPSLLLWLLVAALCLSAALLIGKVMQEQSMNSRASTMHCFH